MARISIRPATPRDAAQAVEVLRESITALCVLDHGDDPAKLGPWLQNKTPEHFLRWLDEPDSWLIVAERETELCGVAMIHACHYVRLCYVRPGREHAGVGTALLYTLETHAREHGSLQVKLTSSASARGFYERHGYRPSNEAVPGFAGMPVYAYAKALGAKALGVDLRRAIREDIELLFSINEAALRPYVEATFGPWDERFQRELFWTSTDPSTHELFVRDGVPIGFWSVVREADHIDLNRLSLRPEFQRRGIGTALLNELCREAVARAVPIRLQVFPVNPGQGLYLRLGFRVVATTPTHVQMQWGPAP